jgi:hypothetical protein
VNDGNVSCSLLPWDNGSDLPRGGGPGGVGAPIRESRVDHILRCAAARESGVKNAPGC